MHTSTSKLSVVFVVGVLLLSASTGMGLTNGATLQQTGNAGNAGNAGVAFDDQTTNGTTVTVDSVFLPDGGYVVVHNSSLLDGEVVGSVIGVSEYLGPGLNEDVEVTLFDVPGATFDRTELSENETLIAMAHTDDGNETFEFVTSNGTQDGPYLAGGAPVTDSANVTLPPTSGASFTVGNLSAPEGVQRGTTVTVNATVSNPNDVTETQRVEFRFDGALIAAERVTIPGGESTTVSYNVNTSGVTPGEYVHGVYTRTDGELAQLSVVDQVDSFEVSNLTAPETATVGETVNVTATVTNPNAFAIEQGVEFRFDGALAAAQNVTVEGNSSTTVTFAVGTEGLEPGTYVHQVFTREFGDSALLTLTAAPDDTPTAPPQNETPTEPPENETPTETPTEPPENETPTETPTEPPENETPTETPENETAANETTA
jgi:hypothetical protein